MEIPLFERFVTSFCPLVLEWLGMVDLARLDIALCNHSLRPSLLAAYRTSDFEGIDSTTRRPCDSIGYLRWMSRRGLLVRKICAVQCAENISSWKVLREAMDSLILAQGHRRCIKLDIEPAPYDIGRLIPLLQNLESLSILHNTFFGPVMVGKAFQEPMPSLRELFICASCVTRSGLWQAVARNCPALESLKVGDPLDEDHLLYGGAFTDESIQALAENCPRLRNLKLHSIEPLTLITTQSVIFLSEHCRDLSVFEVRCDIADSAVSALASNCPLLSELYLSSHLLTNQALRDLKNYSNNLMVVTVEGCENISVEDVDDFRNSMRSCRIVCV